jgi:hypothetical protein
VNAQGKKQKTTPGALDDAHHHRAQKGRLNNAQGFVKDAAGIFFANGKQVVGPGPDAAVVNQ